MRRLEPTVGEAKRRKATMAAAPSEPHVYPSGLTWAEVEEIASEDPDDREIRLHHGFDRDDPDDVLCPRGCGLTYGGVIAGKVRIIGGHDHE
jgi:hypothetical protein